MRTIENVIASIPLNPSKPVADSVKARWDSLTKPRGSLGRLEDAVVQLAVIQDTPAPRVERRGMYVFCGDHGITTEGVSPYPSVVTREMVKNFLRGGAAINVLCRQLAIETCIVDAGVAGPKISGALDRRIAEGTRNFLQEPAMSREQAITAMERGIELAYDAAGKFDLAGIGEMGIGNSTAASALLCAFTGLSAEQSAGRGAGLDEAGLLHKRQVLTGALARCRIHADDPLNTVAELGGFEIAMMAGFLLGAAANKLPVIVDGFISGAAFLIARAFYAEIGSHVLFAHRSAERGHAALLAAVGASPLLDLDMRLGEGTGAALAIGLLTSAVHLYREMATFEEASVSDMEGKGANDR
ncbi:MAG: nicotinate-nucleotide--dimethylbenzimidazole phosphoribosyltransferase [Acidobacteriota bacterium]|nr:nicotinate-nucleotide--dimethylbenzimidazole phosphoribosyltransferase [Acidobacteriota bacterium]